METLEMLENLRLLALSDGAVRETLLKTRGESRPVNAFCREAGRLGCPLYPMDLIGAGEEFYAAIRRSTNGGGENSPKLSGEDDLYEQFFAELEHKNEEE